MRKEEIQGLLDRSEVAFTQSDFEHSLEHSQKALELAEKHGFKSEKANAQRLLGNVCLALCSYEKAIEHYEASLLIYEALGDKSGEALVKGNIGIVHYRLSSNEKALEYFEEALLLCKPLGDKSSIAKITTCIGAVYYSLDSYEKALAYFEEAHALYHELGDKSKVALVTGNIGLVYYNLDSYEKALEHYEEALSIHQILGVKSGVGSVTLNMGIAYHHLGLFEKALEYLEAALLVHQALGAKSDVVIAYREMGEIYSTPKFKGYNTAKAEEYLLQAIAINGEINVKANYVYVFKKLAQLYEQTERWKEANHYLWKYHELGKEVQSEEAKKKATQLDHQRKIDEYEKELAIKKAAQDAKHEATQSLLHKVMPDIIAKRMVDGEGEIADYFDSVSILFSDIVGFTPMSATMPPHILVRLLNHIFKEFDQIMKRNGCEKIKTIGDGYMAVAGAPIACDDHAERMATAALEMKNAIAIPEDIKVFMPEGTRLNIRIGIHTGSVVAGVVGEDRFVYDIYSDAVNTAARMESHGESGKIHVSSDFMRHLLNRFAQTKVIDHGITFIKREEMELKGKGKMKTFFLEKEIKL